MRINHVLFEGERMILCFFLEFVVVVVFNKLRRKEVVEELLRITVPHWLLISKIVAYSLYFNSELQGR